MQIIVKNYAGYNHAMGKNIKSRDHYDYEMKKGGYVDYDKAKEQAAAYDAKSRKEYKPSAKALEILRTVKDSADKKGNVKLSDRTIDAMKSIGALKGVSRDTSKMSIKKGGLI